MRIDSTLQNVWSDNYAPFYLACEYAQKELSSDYLVKCYWPHGCYLPVEEFDIDMVTDSQINAGVCGAKRDAGFHGPPWIYKC